ncbi:hypothetical protein EXS70_04500 [Candidatus Peribacteria bacterium]|nr:hypothetical protein [Candidatus Peribacteria bacterium]
MRARYTRSIGLPIQEEETGEQVGSISGILIHPDTGTVEGFFVYAPSMFSGEDLFLSTADILHWGLRVSVRRREVLMPVGDLIRLQPILEGNRPVLGQRMLTEGGRTLGRCGDVQFSTRDFRLEWLFPRRFFRWRPAVPASQIIEVTLQGIVLREGVLPATEAEVGAPMIPQLPEVV